jgi:biopolymer transport protein ExbD
MPEAYIRSDARSEERQSLPDITPYFVVLLIILYIFANIQYIFYNIDIMINMVYFKYGVH